MVVSASAQRIDELAAKMKADSDSAALLIESLKQAREIAQAQLDPALYNALSWPVDLTGYEKYLTEFSKWIPRQSGDEVWKKPGTDEHQEVYDRLCHFYWLINQKVGPNRDTVVQSIPYFDEFLLFFARDWGSFLNTTDSFSQEIMESFIKYSPEYAVKDSMIDGRPNAPSGWLTFNQFFGRELNPGLRPIANPADNRIVTSPADCTFRKRYDIGPDSTIPEITVKKTHKFASIEDLLEGSQYKSAFANGTFAHYFLGPYSYHRFHTPVAGVVRECFSVTGLVYLDVNITGGQFDAPDSSQGGYEFAQARGIIIIDTTDSPFGDIGLVAVVPVGMCQVSSVNMTATVGKSLLKGDEFGYFLFGGSDIIVLFQEGVKPQIDTGSQYRNYGTQIASCCKSSEGKVSFDLEIGTLSSNKSLFIHAGSYTTRYQQRGSITIKEKNSPGTEQTFNFKPTSSVVGYTEMLNQTFSVKDNTFYEVTVTIENDRETGGRAWYPSTIMPPAQLSAGNYHEKVVTSEDMKDPDDVNDTVVRLVWFTRP
ncbi:Phosphatidylserine decarboxylase [Desulfonema limicola]|uniref:Phosphatidylserine decarboxylase n=1 Tax=Desulfonema limicola TaxID=45656 RepID=A0A975GIJ8_9BACT|nr:phosphatidylserine decarboxylase [Desulfonema limicola]QTA82018.1 Phosphatidylserine decarboxylase [Desulfonema limicola]